MCVLIICEVDASHCCHADGAAVTFVAPTNGLRVEAESEMAVLRYVSHPNVVIDPNVPVPQWGLSDLGRSRAHSLLDQPWIDSVRRIVASAETKAQHTAEILATFLDLEIETRPLTGETDRSATGFVPHDRHEELAARYFAQPTMSADGWERSIDSQRRIVDATVDLFDQAQTSDIVIVGHGGVGTLLYAHIARLKIDQRHDQPGQGHYWAFDIADQTVLHPWRAVDDIEPNVQ